MPDLCRLFSAELFQSSAPFSHVAVSRTGLAFISGLIGQRRDTGELVSAELRPQAEAMFGNLITLLAEARLDARALVQTTLYLTSYNDFAEVNAIYRERLPEPYPARVTLQVAGLPLGARVQIDAVVDTLPTSDG
jgi:2-iminobutanoate/2-iminopropanoate deaminase